MDDARSQAIAAVERELAEMAAADADVAAGLAQRHRREDLAANPASAVFSIRLDSDELAALRRQAATVGLGPTVLARNFVRAGLRRRGD